MNAIKLLLAAGTLALAFTMTSTVPAAACGTGRLSIPCHTTISNGSAWWLMACPGGVVTAAMAKNWKRHKELTSQEAWTCGLLYWWNEGTGQYGH